MKGRQEKYALNSQLARSSKAIPRLIAESFAKKHQKSGSQKYLDDAMAECNETVVSLKHVKDIYEVDMCNDLLSKYDISARQLSELALAWDSLQNCRRVTKNHTGCEEK